MTSFHTLAIRAREAAEAASPGYHDACKVAVSALPPEWTEADLLTIFTDDERLRDEIWRAAARKAIHLILDHARSIGVHE